MKNKRLIFVLLLILNIILIGIIYNVIDKNPIKIKESKVIKEMTETEYDSQITELNKSHTEYATKVQENKKKIADAITNQGVQTSEDDTIETITENIEKIAQQLNDKVFKSIDAPFTYSKTVTINLSEYTSNYKELILWQNLFVVVVSTRIESGVANKWSIPLYSYDQENGILSIRGNTPGQTSMSPDYTASIGLSCKVYYQE